MEGGQPWSACVMKLPHRNTSAQFATVLLEGPWDLATVAILTITRNPNSGTYNLTYEAPDPHIHPNTSMEACDRAGACSIIEVLLKP